MGQDHNAAINIKNRYVRADCPELTPVEKGCTSNRYESGSPVTCSGEDVTPHHQIFLLLQTFHGDGSTEQRANI
ncbi:MAG TPA: hypothetical protein ENF23_04145 [Methanosarcinales archaeon]|nr:hypothetical protein [Methanosarcinales archaeon]